MNQPKEQVEVPEALSGVRERLERIRDLDEQTSDGALGSLARYALDELAEAPRAIEQAVEERVRERLLSNEAVDAVTGYMEWPRDGFVGDTTAWRKAHARAALERLAAALSQPHNTEEEK